MQKKTSKLKRASNNQTKKTIKGRWTKERTTRWARRGKRHEDEDTNAQREEDAGLDVSLLRTGIAPTDCRCCIVKWAETEGREEEKDDSNLLDRPTACFFA